MSSAVVTLMPTPEIAGSETFLRRLLAANNSAQALQITADHVVRALGTAVSWIGLVDGDYLVMGAHSGLGSAEMASAWRLGIGEGIGGRVAADRRPHMSRDYRHDSRRVPLMKRLIDNEGIQATLTVPLLIGDEALGVLYAAQRTPYDWSEWEQGALDGIGQDLALRLRQLDVDGQREHRCEVLEDELERSISSQRALAVLATSLNERDDGGSALDLVARETNALVELRSGDGHLLRSTGQIGTGNPRQLWRRELVGSDGMTVTVIGARDLDRAARSTAEVATGLFRLQHLRLTAGERTTERLTGELVDQLLNGRVQDSAAVVRRMTMLGLPNGRGRVVVVGIPHDRGDASALRAEVTDVLPGCVTAERRGRVVVIVGHEPPDGLREALTRVLVRRAWRGGVAGLGRPCREVGDYASSYEEARAACELGLRGGDQRPVLTAKDLGIAPLAGVPVGHLHTMVQDALGPLLDTDRGRGSEFVETLRVYLAHDRHLPATAAALHVHYNTVRNRVARIEELLGVDMRDPEDRFQLETALRMHALIDALDDDLAELSGRDSATGH